MAGDGQVSLGETVVKHSARKIRRLGKKADILAGFAGSTADSLTLLEKFEQMLEKYSNNLTRGCSGTGQGMAYGQDASAPRSLAHRGGLGKNTFAVR